MAENDPWAEVAAQTDPWADVSQQVDPWDKIARATESAISTPATISGPSNGYIDAAKRIVPSIVGGLLGSAIGPWGTAGGGAAGAALGSWWAGDSLGEGALNTAMGAVPAIPLAKTLGTAARIGIRAAEGAGMGGISQGASNLIEGRPVTEGLAQALAMGTGLGAAGGTIERALMGAPGKVVSRPILDAPTTPVHEQYQPNLFNPAELEATVDPRLAKIQQLEAEQTALRAQKARQETWAKKRHGTQGQLFDEPAVDPITRAIPQRVTQLDEKQIRTMNAMARKNPLQAARYLESLVDPEQLRRAEKVAGELGENFSGANAIGGSQPTSFVGRELRRFGQAGTKMVGSFGQAGASLADDMVKVKLLNEQDFTRTLAHSQLGWETITKGLTDAEDINLGKVLNGIASPVNSKVADIVPKAQQLLAEFETRAPAAGLMLKDPTTGKHVPWQPHVGPYFPNMPDYGAIAKDPSRMSKAVQEIMDQVNTKRIAANKPTITLGEAQTQFDHMVRNSRMEYGNLESMRTFQLSDVDYHATKVISQYIKRAVPRINQATVFGPANEKAYSKVVGIGMQVDDEAAKLSRELVDRMTGKHINSSLEGAVKEANAIMGPLEVITKLPFAWLNNMSQPALTGMITGYGNLLKGRAFLSTPEGREMAQLAGGSVEQIMRDMIDIGSTKSSGMFGRAANTLMTKVTPFSYVETGNRMWATATGKVFGDNLAKKFLANPTGYRADFYKDSFRKMGVEPMDVLSRGKLTAEEEITIGRWMKNHTQFTTGTGDVPLFMSSEYGKWLLQFQQFAFKSGELMYNDVMKPAALFMKTQGHNGNMMPMLRALTVLPVIGEGFADVAAWISGRERTEQPALRYLENLAYVGGLGIAWDAARAATSGTGGLYRYFVGVKNADILDAATNTVKLVSGNPRPIAKQTISNIPIAGRILTNRMFPPKEQ